MPQTTWHIFIGGLEVENILQGSINLTSALASRSTLEFSILDQQYSMTVVPGQQVILDWGTTRIFGGTVEEVTLESTNADTARFIHVSCIDWAQLLDRFYVANHYDDKTVREIVTDIVNVQTVLAAEGVTIGSIQDGPAILRAVFNYTKVTDVFRDLAEVSGLNWSIDEHKVITFFDRATYPAPFSIGDDGGRAYRSLSWRKSRDQYYNRLILRGGQDRTDLRVEYFRGDPVTVEPSKRRRTFNLSYPVADIVAVYRYSSTGGGVLQRIGIKGIDQDENVGNVNFTQWFYQFDETEISQNSADNDAVNSPLSDIDILEVRYHGHFPMLLDSQNDSEIKKRWTG